jgi:ribosomal protein L23
LISGLLASAATLKVTWLCSEPLVVFSVISGARSDWKKAIVSLVEGHKIDVTTGL